MVAFSALDPEIPQNSVLEASWGDFPRWAQKRLQTAVLHIRCSWVSAGTRKTLQNPCRFTNCVPPKRENIAKHDRFPK